MVPLTPRCQHPEELGEPGSAAEAARLHRPHRAVEHLGHLGDRVALHVHEHQGRPLLDGQRRQRGEHRFPAVAADRDLGGVLGVGRGRGEGAAALVLLEVVGERVGAARPP